MNISIEFAISLVVQLLILAFFVGIYVATIRFMLAQLSELKITLKADKEELKKDMKKYNNFLERLIICEQSTKSAHHRLDDHIEREKDV